MRSVVFKVILNSFVQCTKALLKNTVPLSCTICWGIPNLVLYFSINLTVSGASAVSDGKTCIKREKLSIITRQNFFGLLQGLNGPFLSICMV